MAKPRIAVFSGPTATIQNSPPLVTSNKARALHGLPLLMNGAGQFPQSFDMFIRADAEHPRPALSVRLYEGVSCDYQTDLSAAQFSIKLYQLLGNLSVFRRHPLICRGADEPIRQLQLVYRYRLKNFIHPCFSFMKEIIVRNKSFYQKPKNPSKGLHGRNGLQISSLFVSNSNETVCRIHV